MNTRASRACMPFAVSQVRKHRTAAAWQVPVMEHGLGEPPTGLAGAAPYRGQSALEAPVESTDGKQAVIARGLRQFQRLQVGGSDGFLDEQMLAPLRSSQAGRES